MNNKIFLEYENPLLKNLVLEIYDFFLENNYDVILLDNTLSFEEKTNIIKESKKKKNPYTKLFLPSFCITGNVPSSLIRVSSEEKDVI